MGAYDEEGLTVAAANILLSLRNRRLLRSPEWAPRASEKPTAASAEALALMPLEVWPKRRRSPPHALAKEKSKAATAWTLAAQNLGAPMEYDPGAGSGASSSWEDGARLPPHATEKPKVKAELLAARRPETPLYYDAAAGSGPSTSGVDRARSQPRPCASDKAQAAARKEAMAAPSPETPLDYAAATGSGASSSGEDAARSPAKRKAPGAGGSGGASSGDERCISPAKRARAYAAAVDGGGQATAAAVKETAAAVKETAAAVKVEEPKIQSRSSPYRDENGMLLFDLNEDLNISWED